MANVRRKKPLKYFKSHEDQEQKDLAYGSQKEACAELAKKKVVFEDHSIQRDWAPDTD